MNTGHLWHLFHLKLSFLLDKKRGKSLGMVSLLYHCFWLFCWGDFVIWLSRFSVLGMSMTKQLLSLTLIRWRWYRKKEQTCSEFKWLNRGRKYWEHAFSWNGLKGTSFLKGGCLFKTIVFFLPTYFVSWLLQLCFINRWSSNVLCSACHWCWSIYSLSFSGIDVSTDFGMIMFSLSQCSELNLVIKRSDVT